MSSSRSRAATCLKLDRVGAAVAEAEKAGWLDGVEVSVFEGSDEYLYGEETALLEAIHGRPPFPRIRAAVAPGADRGGSDGRGRDVLRAAKRPLSTWRVRRGTTGAG